MVAADLVRAVLHGTLAVLIVTGAVQVWHIVSIGLLYGSAEAFFRPAYSGLVPQTVSRGRHQPAQALGGFSPEIGEFVSPALATAWCSASAARPRRARRGTFPISARWCRVTGRTRGEAGERRVDGRELLEGWDAVRSGAGSGGRSWSSTLCADARARAVLGARCGRRPRRVRDQRGVRPGPTPHRRGHGERGNPRLPLGPHRPMLAGMLASISWPAPSAVRLGPPLPSCFTPMAIRCGLGLFAVWWETALAQRMPPHLLSRVSAWDWMGSLALLAGGLPAGRARQGHGRGAGAGDRRVAGHRGAGTGHAARARPVPWSGSRTLGCPRSTCRCRWRR